MKVTTIDDYRQIDGDIDIDSLESIIVELIDFLGKNKVSWKDGIEIINDVFYLKKQDHSVLSNETSYFVLGWIENNYDNSDFVDFSSFVEGENSREEKLFKLMEFVVDTFYYLSKSIEVIPFVRRRLELAKTNFEIYELEECIRNIEMFTKNKIPFIEPEILDEVLERVDNYFELEYKEKRNSDLFCGLRDSIMEHKSSYSISWCIKKQKYWSKVKRSVFIGGGRVFLSKETDLIKMSGSAPTNDWEEWFELEIYQLESYWILEISYNKKKISSLKALLNCSTPELLKMVNKESKIIIEDKLYVLKRLKKDLDESKINNQLNKFRRNRTQDKMNSIT